MGAVRRYEIPIGLMAKLQELSTEHFFLEARRRACACVDRRVVACGLVAQTIGPSPVCHRVRVVYSACGRAGRAIGRRQRCRLRAGVITPRFPSLLAPIDAAFARWLMRERGSS